MLITLVKYLGMLAIGVVFGYKGLAKGKLEKNLLNILNFGLLFLLFIMGITIGINEDILKNIFNIGYKAAIITIFTISFSVLGIYLIRNIVLPEDEKIEP